MEYRLLKIFLTTRQIQTETYFKIRRNYIPRDVWAHMGPILFKKLLILIKNHKNINKDMKIVNLEILKVKTWFGDKDL